MPKWRADYFESESSDVPKRYVIITASSEENAVKVANAVKGDAHHFRFTAIDEKERVSQK